jgi:hypothetical protein
METLESKAIRLNQLEKEVLKKNRMGLWANIIFLSVVLVLLYATLTNKSWNIMKVESEDLTFLKFFLVFACLLFSTGIVHFIILLRKQRKNQS